LDRPGGGDLQDRSGGGGREGRHQRYADSMI